MFLSEDWRFIYLLTGSISCNHWTKSTVYSSMSSMQKISFTYRPQPQIPTIPSENKKNILSLQVNIYYTFSFYIHYLEED